MTSSSSANSGKVLKMALDCDAAAIVMGASIQLITAPDSHGSAKLQAPSGITLVTLPSLHAFPIRLLPKSVTAGHISKS
jgi:hypothetical protein